MESSLHLKLACGIPPGRRSEVASHLVSKSSRHDEFAKSLGGRSAIQKLLNGGKLSAHYVASMGKIQGTLCISRSSIWSKAGRCSHVRKLGPLSRSVDCFFCPPNKAGRGITSTLRLCGLHNSICTDDVRYPAPTIAIRGTLGSSDGCVEIFCTDDSISGNRIDPIFSSCRRPSLGPASCKFFFSTGGREPLQSSDLVTTKLREVSLFPPCGVRATSRSHTLHSHPSISRLH